MTVYSDGSITAFSWLGRICAFASRSWRGSVIYRAFTSDGLIGKSLCGRTICRTASWAVGRKYDLLVFVLAAYGIIDVVFRKLNATLGSVWDEMFLDTPCSHVHFQVDS